MMLEKRRGKKSLALSEILILVISIIAFSYFVGNEFQFVGAAGGVKLTKTVEELFKLGEAATSADVSRAAVLVNPSGVGAVTVGTGTTGEAAAASILESGRAAGTIGGTGGTETTTYIGKTFTWKSVGAQLKNILGNAGIAYVLYLGIAKGLAALFPDVDPELWESLGKSVGWGYFSGATAATVVNWIAPNTFGTLFSVVGMPVTWGGIIGIGIGVLIWLFTYKKEYSAAVTYSCFPWQPETGGEDCQKCNTGEFPCTKYKCQSLGQSCELLNAGTSDEVCEWVNRNDVKYPSIEAWEGTLTEGYRYIEDNARLPPDRGVVIENMQRADKCVPAFTRIDYGVTLDEPGRCKIDTVRTGTFNEMKYFASSGYYKYNHTISLIHAGASELEDEGIVLQNGGVYETFVRCEDKNGNSNSGTFVFKYCVQNESDLTAPTIKLTNPLNGMPFQQGKTSLNIEVYVDKPSDCKWSHSDEDYDTMPNMMQCSQNIFDINANMFYKCTTTLTGLRDNAENNFYFRCNSYPSHDTDNDAETVRYKNEESYKYTLFGTKQLVIDSVSPVSGTTIKDATQSVKVTLEAKTSAGYKDGEAKCYFKEAAEADSSYVLFLNTNSYQSTQDLWLPRGSYRYTIRCCDLGGNCDTETTDFTVDTDFQSPAIARAYNEGTSLKIITTEEAECVYDTTSCSYSFEDGIAMTSSDGLNHFTEWDTNTNFYLKCQDSFGNRPIADSCSMIIRPSSLT